MVQPENDFSRRHFTISESAFDHFVLSTAFMVGLVSSPRRTLGALKKEGMSGLSRGYRNFFDNMRPGLYYLNPKH